MVSCGECPQCLNGVTVACDHLAGWGGKDDTGHAIDGGQGQAVRVPLAESTLVKVPGVTDPDDALRASLLTLSDVMATGHHAALAAKAGPGRTVVVVGDGAVGLCGVLAAKRLGAERIIAMSRHADRQAIAREFGATDIVAERGDDGVAKVRELLGGVLADSVLECVGTKESMEQALHSVRPGGALGFVGVPTGGAEAPLRYLFDTNISIARRHGSGPDVHPGTAGGRARRHHQSGPGVRRRDAAGGGARGLPGHGRTARHQGRC